MQEFTIYNRDWKYDYETFHHFITFGYFYTQSVYVSSTPFRLILMNVCLSRNVQNRDDTGKDTQKK